jgi:predicted Zn-dependent protease
MSTQAHGQACKEFLARMAIAGLLLLPGFAYGIERLKFKPGFNMFSPQQDLQVGKEASGQVEKELPLVTDPVVVQYINGLGRRLATFAPYNDQNYAWEFKVVNSPDINAFALPGGFIYVNRGAIEAAEDEAEIAGAMAHESGHVVLRHGTHQASEIMLAQLPLGILGSLFGQSTGLTAQLAQMGLGFTINSLLLKNSRNMESQADEVGTFVLYKAGYDPRAMANFFQIIEKKYPQKTLQFFSDHPNPENRIKDVDAQITKLGSPRAGTIDNTAFESAKRRLLSLPVAPKPKPAAQPSASSAGAPPLPSNCPVGVGEMAPARAPI